MSLKTGRTQVPVQTEDVSFSGVFVVSPVDLPVRQLVQLEAKIDASGADGREAFSAHAMVVFARPASDGKSAGAGLKFFGLSRETLERWVRFVRAVRERELATLPREQAPRAARAAVVLKVRPQGLDALLEVYTRDIAEGGMFVETDQPLLVGSRLMAELVHPDTGETFELECVVRRNQGAPSPGIGVEFVALDDARTQSLQEFVSTVIPPLLIEEAEEADR
jgi:type IV pilus assembly protein PilZ